MAAYGFTLDEDNALKAKLLNGPYPNGAPNFFVTNYVDGTLIPINVFYRSPDTEIRTRTFPHLAIDLIDIEPDHERMHRALGFVVPYPTETATPAVGFYDVADDFPFPWMLHYQISAISRDPTHDRQLGQLLFRMFPYQYGSLDMTGFDGTVRRADLLSMERRDLPADATNKRLYRQIFTIGVSSEFYLNQITQIQQVISVKTTVTTTSPVIVGP
jgi:hypothetical protein